MRADRRRARPRATAAEGLPGPTAEIFLGPALGHLVGYVDKIMDMARTAVNARGNCIAPAVVTRWEGVFDDAQMRAFVVASTSRAA